MDLFFDFIFFTFGQTVWDLVDGTGGRLAILILLTKSLQTYEQ
ncbi:MAG: hypothetical protein QOD84_1006 [Acidobacteriaceae bacterium]|jgi:hypothetical protein